MSSGGTEIQINSGERAISDDQNRAQRFREADLNELLRAIVDTFSGIDDLVASSSDIRSSVSTAPVSASVFNGLVVRPQLGTLNLLVDPGVVGLYDPDAAPNPDESQFKVIRDPGVAGGAPLVMAANASGSIRIDVIECARVAAPGVLVLETDNRDVFNPATGLFTPTTVNKVIAGRLQYRIRSGAPGAGFPANQAGWLPLAVASVPTGTATVNTVTFWDVRPFVGDRIFGAYNLGTFAPRSRRNVASVDTITIPGKAVLSGAIETSATDTNVASTGVGASLYRLGGLFDGAYDFNVAGNQSGPLGAGLAYVYLAEPFGLPRWAVYAMSGGILQPRYRGIPIISNTGAVPILGSPSAALALPANTGLLGTTSKAVCILATKFVGAVVIGALGDGHSQTCLAQLFAPKAATVASPTVKWAFTAGTDYPASATALWVTITCDLNVISGVVGNFNAPFLQVENEAFTGIWTTLQMGDERFDNSASTGTTSYRFTRRVKVPVPEDSGFGLFLTTGEVNCTLFGGICYVDGWEF